MTKIKVFICSNAGLDYIKHPYDIDVFRSVVQYSADEVYDDYTEISAETFYNRLETDKESFPRTAYVSPGKMINFFEEAKAEGYTGALVIVIAKPLSGLHDAVKTYGAQVDDFDVTVYDSKTISYPEALMALEAARMFNEDKSLEEVLERLDFIRDNNKLYFAVDTLEYLIKNGRLSKAAGAFANLLKIRPVLTLDKDGKVETVEKVRTSTVARKKVCEMILDEVEGKDAEIFIIHSLATEDMIKQMKEIICQRRPELKPEDIKDYLLTPVVGSHTGPKTVCLGYILR